ncbi:MAG TPA: hypothetical protein VMB34_19230 [Acetobacteraceae bacterium]|nr:hypothetical protein [Acetobacteraceae bacterium]
MTLAATGRFTAAGRTLAGLRHFAQGLGSLRKLVDEVALSVTESVLLHARGDYTRVVARMRPALGALHRVGGSHAQRDVPEQLYLDLAMKAELQDDACLLLERIAGRHPVPPMRRAG